LLPTIGQPESHFDLNDSQKNALDSITKAIESKSGETFLIFGVTGSGKTEIYLESCRRALALGKKATVLVPEIALTYQTVRRFMQAFPGRIALLHSELTKRERLHEWRSVRRGERDIVIGARSALFAPVENRGLIIIDEESETAYKQHQRPRYHAREVARRMAKTEGSVLILGSATPSLESFHAAKSGQFRLIRLPSRAVGGALPNVRLIRPDIVLTSRKTENDKSLTIDGRELPIGLLSTDLRNEVALTLEMKRQALLFLNLRGFSQALICPKCGWVPLCPECDIALTYHRKSHTRCCHHCGHSAPVAWVCEKCGNKDMKYLGWGTERLEAEVRELFPDARVMRMDRDTVSTRGRRKKIVDAVHSGEADILLGTQMIAKGLHFPSVRLVGVISADQSLHMPDFRAAERTFQLLTQVIGRAGRSDFLESEGGGVAVIQSYDPVNRVLENACRQDFESFYESEIILRRKFVYPPICHVARIVMSGTNKEIIWKLCMAFASALLSAKSGDDMSFLGPSPAPLERLEGKYRFHFILKAPRVSRLTNWLISARKMTRPERNVKIEIDIDPVSML
ncbi:MAG: primosomal protein N', partial [bacterium]